MPIVVVCCLSQCFSSLYRLYFDGLWWWFLYKNQWPTKYQKLMIKQYDFCWSGPVNWNNSFYPYISGSFSCIVFYSIGKTIVKSRANVLSISQITQWPYSHDRDKMWWIVFLLLLMHSKYRQNKCATKSLIYQKCVTEKKIQCPRIYFK